MKSKDLRFKNTNYKKHDLVCQKIFGCEYFNWLTGWEQFHLINKYNLECKQTKN
jgi:hypothetical protein